MKRTWIVFSVLIMLFGVINRASGQDSESCITAESPEVPQGCFSHATYSSYTPGDTLGPIKLKFHVLRKSDGTSNFVDIDQPDTLRKLFDEIKAAFLADHIRILFEFDTSLDRIDDTQLYDNIRNNVWSAAALGARFDESCALNVYFTPRAKYSNEAFYGIGRPYGSVLLGSNAWWDFGVLYMNSRIAIHEIGHVLGLKHVFDFGSGIEKIRRDSLKNCYDAGDNCCDTRAHPARGQSDAAWYNPQTCSLDSAHMADLSDPDGIKYVEAPDSLKTGPSNFMTVPTQTYPSNSALHCMTTYTPEQAMIMRCNVALWECRPIYPLVLKNRTATVENIGDSLMVRLNGMYALSVKPNTALPSGEHYMAFHALPDTIVAKDRVEYSSTSYKQWSWAGDPAQTDIRRGYRYDCTKQVGINSDSVTAHFADTPTGVSIMSKVDGLSVSGLHFKWLDPWNTTGHYDGPWCLFGRYRNRIGYTTASTPFTPVNGGLINMDYRSESTKQYSFYRAQAALGLRAPADTGAFDPATSPAGIGELVLTGWNSTQQLAFGPVSNVSKYEERPVIFRTPDHVVTLEYKGHLLSTSDLACNSQRKLVFNNSTYYFAYNSGGSSWLTRKGSGAGDSWIPERRIGFSKDAPVSIDALDSRLFAVYAQGNYWEVRELGPSTLGTVDSLLLPLAASDSASQSVIAKQTAQDVVVTAAAFQRAGAKTIGVYALTLQAGGSLTPSDSAMVGGLIGACANPTLVCDASGAFHLAWEEDGRILYRRFLVDVNGHIDSLDTMPFEVSDCLGISHGAKPCITVDEGNRPHVVWETAMNEIRAVEWPDPVDHSYGRNIAHRMKRVPSDPAS